MGDEEEGGVRESMLSWRDETDSIARLAGLAVAEVVDRGGMAVDGEMLIRRPAGELPPSELRGERLDMVLSFGNGTGAVVVGISGFTEREFARVEGCELSSITLRSARSGLIARICFAYLRSPLPIYALIASHSLDAAWLFPSSTKCANDSSVRVPLVCLASSCSADGGNVGGSGTERGSKLRHTKNASVMFR